MNITWAPIHKNYKALAARLSFTGSIGGGIGGHFIRKGGCAPQFQSVMMSFPSVEIEKFNNVPKKLYI